jgi:hypothetical protein
MVFVKPKSPRPFRVYPHVLWDHGKELVRSDRARFDDHAFTFPHGWEIISGIYTGSLTFWNKNSSYSANILPIEIATLPRTIFSNNDELTTSTIEGIVSNKQFSLAFVLLTLMVDSHRIEAIYDISPNLYGNLLSACGVDDDDSPIIVWTMVDVYEQYFVQMNSKGITRTKVGSSFFQEGRLDKIKLPNEKTLSWPEDAAYWVIMDDKRRP